jgi:hypothetical protein
MPSLGYRSDPRLTANNLHLLREREQMCKAAQCNFFIIVDHILRNSPFANGPGPYIDAIGQLAV